MSTTGISTATSRRSAYAQVLSKLLLIVPLGLLVGARHLAPEVPVGRWMLLCLLLYLGSRSLWAVFEMRYRLQGWPARGGSARSELALAGVWIVYTLMVSRPAPLATDLLLCLGALALLVGAGLLTVWGNARFRPPWGERRRQVSEPPPDPTPPSQTGHVIRPGDPEWYR
jgi:hypothetical protein